MDFENFTLPSSKRNLIDFETEGKYHRVQNETLWTLRILHYRVQNEPLLILRILQYRVQNETLWTLRQKENITVFKTKHRDYKMSDHLFSASAPFKTLAFGAFDVTDKAAVW